MSSGWPHQRLALGVMPRLVAEERVLLVPAFAGHPQRVGELLVKYPEMDAGDAKLSELYPRAKLITVDDDFRRYRRLRNQAIPLVMPETL
jgi:hypothetical protein